MFFNRQQRRCGHGCGVSALGASSSCPLERSTRLLLCFIIVLTLLEHSESHPIRSSTVRFCRVAIESLVPQSARSGAILPTLAGSWQGHRNCIHDTLSPSLMSRLHRTMLIISHITAHLRQPAIHTPHRRGKCGGRTSRHHHDLVRGRSNLRRRPITLMFHSVLSFEGQGS